jgi:hypothetical protein
MGLIEKAQSVEGKKLMTSVFLAEGLDIAMTALSLNHYGGTEISPFGGAELLRNFDQNEAFILKMGVVAILIGIYALTSIYEPQINIAKSKIKAKYVTERALQGANIFAWGVIAWNSANLAPDIITKGIGL